MIRFWNQLSSPRIIQVAPDCLQIRGKVVHHYALEDRGRITLIDGGFLTCRPQTTLRKLEEIGHHASEIDTILVSHGHIDHTLHLREWKERTGARIYAPARDRDHIEGVHAYRGASRFCGILERTARSLFHYLPPEIDYWYDDEETLPVWGGLQVIGLPGHTQGHSGFYSRDRQLLFANDLFAHWFGHSHWPPNWLNESSREIPVSAKKLLDLPLESGILLNHCDESSPRLLREELGRLLNH